MDAKRVDKLTESDFRTAPVWQFTNSDEDETVVRPVKEVPVTSLRNTVVGVQVTLANGTERWAMIGNVAPRNARLTKHWLTLSILERSKWFHLGRYHDHDATKRGPKALAAFLKLRVDDVFPITYDISRYVKGDRDALVGTVEKKPQERLTRAQVIALAVPRRSDNPDIFD